MHKHTEGRADKAHRDCGLRRHRQARLETGDQRSHDIMNVTYVAWRFLSPGAVVRADFPYADGTGRKVRPAVVVRREGHSVSLMPITSSRRATDGIEVTDLQRAGLHKASRVRPNDITVVDRYAAIEVLGTLSGRDFMRILMMRSVA